VATDRGPRQIAAVGATKAAFRFVERSGCHSTRRVIHKIINCKLIKL